MCVYYKFSFLIHFYSCWNVNFIRHILSPYGNRLWFFRELCKKHGERSENKALVKDGIDDLKGTKYLWLTNPGHWSDKYKRIFKELKDKNLKVGLAWSPKETFSDLCRYICTRYKKSAGNSFKRWCYWATQSQSKPFERYSRSCKTLGSQ